MTDIAHAPRHVLVDAIPAPPTLPTFFPEEPEAVSTLDRPSWIGDSMSRAWWSELLPRTSGTPAAWLLVFVPPAALLALGTVGSLAADHPRRAVIVLGLAVIGVLLGPVLLVASDIAQLQRLGWNRAPRASGILLGPVGYLLLRASGLSEQGARTRTLTAVTIVVAALTVAIGVGMALADPGRPAAVVELIRRVLMP